MQYMRKTPVEAIQWKGDNLNDVHDFIVKTAKYCCSKADSGSLIVAWEDLRGRKFKTVIPKFGWAVREGKTFQFYKDATFHKTFEEVQKGDSKGIDWEGMDKTIKEAFDGFDEVFKGFKDVFGSKPSKKTSGVLSTMMRLNNKGRMAKLIDDLYKGDEKTCEEIKKQLAEGLKEMENSDKTKGTEFDTFNDVQKDDSKGVNEEGTNNTIKEDFKYFDEMLNGFKYIFGTEPNKETLGIIKQSKYIRNAIRSARLTIELSKDNEKTCEEVKKILSEGLKEMAGSDTHKATFESVLDEMKELHAKKNKDYSGSFHNLFKEYGMSYALGHIEEKLNRVKAIIANGGNAVKNEHIEDSLIDGACYNILTLIELRNGKH